jgi:hypothetical protein
MSTGSGIDGDEETCDRSVESAVAVALIEAAELVAQFDVAREAKMGYLVGRVMAICGCDAAQAREEIMRQVHGA